MESRFPLNDAPDPAAKQVMEQLMSDLWKGNRQFPIIEEDEHAMLGYLAPLSYTLDVARDFFAVARTAFHPNNVKPRNRELAVMALISVVDIPYMTYCHQRIGGRLGLTAQQCQDALAGKVPEGLSEEEEAAYSLGRALTALVGPLDDMTYQKFASKMEKSELVGIANIIGGYKWIALLGQVNGMDRRWVE
ncbi:hypothetical protein GGS26DRAFT_585785 [Hypomontagnella submonticulosa]|nr:hypothetical protein GGS26DRAFT_585785 [Hypomontagnella submonticulosa]